MRLSVGPDATTLPTESTYARSAISSARWTFCSTRRIVVPRVAQVGDHLEDAVDVDRAEPERRLVQQQHARPRHQCARDRELLLLSSRQRARELRRPLAQDGERREPPLRVLTEPVAVGPGDPADREVLLDRQLGEHVTTLRDERDPPPDDRLRRHAEDRRAVEPHRAGSRLQRAREGPQQRGLPRPVRAERGDDLPVRDPERDIPERDHAAVGDGEPLDLEQRCRA